MLYELLGVVRPSGKTAEIKELVKTAGMIVLQNGGVVRGISNWGLTFLPKRTRKHQATHHEGHYFLMRFDANAKTQQTVRDTLGLDPRMIKFSVVKLGDRLEDIAGVTGKEQYFR